MTTQTPAAGMTPLPAAGTKPLPPHGTMSRHKCHGCTCDDCRQAGNDYMRMRYRLMAYGRWQPYVNAEPVRAHVRMLSSFDIGITQVRILSGVSGGAFSRLLYGRGEQGPSRRVRTETADKILSIKPSLDAVAPNALVDSTGTKRRLQALVAVGWHQRELARRLGLDRNAVHDQLHQSALAYGSTARAVRDLYNQLWNVTPESEGIAERWANEARTLAKAKGWMPPGAWDDDSIDSPAATPDLGENVARYVAIAEDANWLMDTQGYSPEKAALRLGITRDHLHHALSYARKRGVAS